MKTILKQIKNEWNSNLFLFVELLLVFVVLWYIVDWTLVTARVYHAPMGFDTEHCYNITVSKLGEDSPLYNPELTADDDMDDLLRLTDRLRHCPGVEAVAISQNCFPYNEGSNSIDLGIDSVAVNVRLLWVEADFFRVFRYAFTEEAEFAKVEAAFRNDEPVVSSNLTEGHPELGGSASLPGREVLLLNYGKDVRRRIGAVGTPVRWSHFHTPSQWGGAFAALPLNAKRLRNFGDPRYVTVSLRVSEDADKNFAEKLMNDADRLYQVGNLYLLDITPFSHLREICELEDMNEWKTQLCVLGFLLLNIFLGVIGTFWFRTQQRRKGCAEAGAGQFAPGDFLLSHVRRGVAAYAGGRTGGCHRFQYRLCRTGGCGQDAFRCRTLPAGSCLDMAAYGADDCCRNLVSCLWSDESTPGRSIA